MNKNKLTIKDSSIAFVSSFFIGYLAVFLVSIIIAYLGTLLNIADIENFSKTCVGNLIVTSTLYTAIFLIFRSFTKNKDNKIFAKPKLSKCLFYILIALLTFFALYPIVNSFDFLIGTNTGEPSFSLTFKNYLICLLPMAILPAICEELLFRWLIFKGLQQGGKTFSLVISSLMFSIYHMSIQQTIYPMLFGLLLGSVMLKENNLIYCIIMHFANNFTALTFMFLNVNLFVGKLWYILLAILLATIFMILLIIFIKKQKINKNYTKIEKNYKIILISSLIIMGILWLIINIYK